MSLSNEWTTMVNTAGFKNRYFLVRHGQSEANVSKLVSSIFSVSVANHGLTPLGKEQATLAADKFEAVASKQPETEDVLGSKVNLPQALQQQSQPTATTDSTTLLYNPIDPSNVVFYVSDFKRAYETGYYLKQGLEAKFAEAQKALLAQKTPTREGLQLHVPAFVPEETVVKKTEQTDIEIKPLPLIPFYSHPSLRERFFGVFEGACPSDDIYEKVWRQDEGNGPESGHFSVESIQKVVTRTTELILEIEQIYSDKLIVLVSHGDVAQIVLAVCAAIDPRFHRTLPHMENCDVRELLFVNGQANDDVGCGMEEGVGGEEEQVEEAKQ